MAKNVHSNTKQEDDQVIYKIIAAFVVAAIAIMAVRMIDSRYGYLSYMFPIYNGVTIGAIVFAVLAVAAIIAAIAMKQRPLAPMLLGYTAVICVLFSGSCLILRQFVFDAAPILYSAWVAAALLYAVFLLYQREFFLLSLVTTLAGFLFYYVARVWGSGISSMLILGYGLFAVVAIVIAALTFAASRHSGAVRMFGRKVVLFVRGTPLPIYITCALWTLCAVCIGLLGAVFAYYCLFAAVAYEMIAAIYFTVKMT
ncbi:MAG: hypothetical protein PHS97_04795 [Oscillospiraceae bacterium]|nr:hypothetical protein [Oscillospiraceae bacterium]